MKKKRMKPQDAWDRIWDTFRSATENLGPTLFELVDWNAMEKRYGKIDKKLKLNRDDFKITRKYDSEN